MSQRRVDTGQDRRPTPRQTKSKTLKKRGRARAYQATARARERQCTRMRLNYRLHAPVTRTENSRVWLGPITAKHNGNATQTTHCQESPPSHIFRQALASALFSLSSDASRFCRQFPSPKAGLTPSLPASARQLTLRCKSSVEEKKQVEAQGKGKVQRCRPSVRPSFPLSSAEINPRVIQPARCPEIYWLKSVETIFWPYIFYRIRLRTVDVTNI